MGFFRRWRPRGLGLRTVLFVWFLAAICATAATSVFVLKVTGEHYTPEAHARVRLLVSRQLAGVWHDRPQREALSRAIEDDLGVAVRLLDRRGEEIRAPGRDCRGPVLSRRIPGRGQVNVCIPHRQGAAPLLALGLALLVLAILSGMLARQLSRPVRRIAEAAALFGDGDLDARVQGVVRKGEAGVLADAFDDMADHIGETVRRQKELLAGVSHEMRTPLGHMRLLLELARQGDETAIDELEKEIDEMNELTGELLDHSRLEFSRIEVRPLLAKDAARRALERLGLDAAKLDCDEHPSCQADPTLLGRALTNLIRNAETHGKGLVRLHVRSEGAEVVFSCEDNGDGFDQSKFEAFISGEGGLGLGLALVRRIAQAHGGSVSLEGRGVVSLRVPRTS